MGKHAVRLGIMLRICLYTRVDGAYLHGSMVPVSSTVRTGDPRVPDALKGSARCRVSTLLLPLSKPLLICLLVRAARAIVQPRRLPRRLAPSPPACLVRTSLTGLMALLQSMNLLLFLLMQMDRDSLLVPAARAIAQPR